MRAKKKLLKQTIPHGHNIQKVISLTKLSRAVNASMGRKLLFGSVCCIFLLQPALAQELASVSPTMRADKATEDRLAENARKSKEEYDKLLKYYGDIADREHGTEVEIENAKQQAAKAYDNSFEADRAVYNNLLKASIPVTEQGKWQQLYTENLDIYAKNKDKNYAEWQRVAPGPPAFGSATERLDRDASWAYSHLTGERKALGRADASGSDFYRREIFNKAAFGTYAEKINPYDFEAIVGHYNIYSKWSVKVPSLKGVYKRARPYQVLDGNGNFKKGYEKKTGSSYPSGHATDGYAYAESLMLLFPERMSEIYSRGLQYGESRVVVSSHFPIDVIGSRVGHLLYLSRALEQQPFTEFTQFSAIEAREYLKKSLVDTGACQDSLRQCLGVLPSPVYDDYANNNFKIGYFGQLENRPATAVTAKDLPEISANLLLARFPYLSKEQRLEVLASTAFPNNMISSKENGKPDENWMLINLARAAQGIAWLPETLVVNQNPGGAWDYAGFGTEDEWKNAISGPGGLIKKGTGKLILSGNNAYSGGTQIDQGTLIINGNQQQASGPTVVSSGATLGGHGVIGGDVTVKHGGTLAPGNSIGTLTIAGNYTGQGQLLIEATPQASDKLVVAGTVNISGSELNLLLSPNRAEAWSVINSPFTIIDNQGSAAVAGTFKSVNDLNNLLFLDYAVNYAGGDGNDVTLKLERNGFRFSRYAETPNQVATANAIERLPNNNPIWNAVAVSRYGDPVRQSLNMLSAEVHASLQTALAEDSNQFRSATVDRLRSSLTDASASSEPVLSYGNDESQPVAADTTEPAVWVRGFGVWNDFSGNGNGAAFDSNTGGFLAGVDASIANGWRLGVATGSGKTSLDFDNRTASASSDNYYLGAYTGHQWDKLGLRSGASYTWHQMKTRRQVNVGSLNENLNSRYDAGTVQAFGELGYRIDTKAVAVEPFVNLAHVRFKGDGYAEEGGDASVSGAGNSFRNNLMMLGLHASTDLNTSSIKTKLSGTIAWRHAFNDTVPQANHSFTANDNFTITGAPIARNAAVLDLGVDVKLAEATTLGVSYQGQIVEDKSQHGVNARLNMKF